MPTASAQDLDDETLVVEFKRTRHLGVTVTAIYRDSLTGLVVAGAAYMPTGNRVKLTKWPNSSITQEELGTFEMGIAKAILKSYLLSRGYRHLRRAS